MNVRDIPKQNLKQFYSGMRAGLARFSDAIVPGSSLAEINAVYVRLRAASEKEETEAIKELTQS